VDVDVSRLVQVGDGVGSGAASVSVAAVGRGIGIGIGVGLGVGQGFRISIVTGARENACTSGRCGWRDRNQSPAKGPPTMLVAYSNALQIICALRPVVDQLRSYDANAADQVVRASTSITHNVTEGSSGDSVASELVPTTGSPIRDR
jgi:hypothetical protein